MRLPSLQQHLTFFTQRLQAFMPFPRGGPWAFMELVEDLRFVLLLYPTSDLQPYAGWINALNKDITRVLDEAKERFNIEEAREEAKGKTRMKNSPPEKRVWCDVKPGKKRG